jgi:hypothetical protein
MMFTSPLKPPKLNLVTSSLSSLFSAIVGLLNPKDLADILRHEPWLIRLVVHKDRVDVVPLPVEETGFALTLSL